MADPAEVESRLRFLQDVGLGYLTLDRAIADAVRRRSAADPAGGAVGSSLVGLLYVLDEPTIGLHPRDNRRLLETLIGLRDLGNTVIVVEHDEDTIRAADSSSTSVPARASTAATSLSPDR